MAWRNLLHKNDVARFAQWCQNNGHVVSEPRGEYQLLGVRPEGGPVIHYLYTRERMKEHVTVPGPLVETVMEYLRHKALGEMQYGIQSNSLPDSSPRG